MTTKQFNQGAARFLLIIGAMKSGTTSLFEILGQHPEIMPANVKEPDFFVTDRDEASRESYLGLWPWHPGFRGYALESSVAYTKAPFVNGVPERIRNAELGSYKFIYILRNPLSRIESQVRHGIFSGWGKCLDQGLTDDLIAFSSYAMQIEKYLEHFSQQDILLVVLEEFQKEPDAVLKYLCTELGIDNTFKFSGVEEKRNTGDFFNASPKLAQITQSGFGQYMTRKVLPPPVKNKLRKVIGRMSKPKTEAARVDKRRWRLNDNEREKILVELANDIKKLNSHYGVDVQTHWSIDPDSLVSNPQR